MCFPFSQLLEMIQPNGTVVLTHLVSSFIATAGEENISTLSKLTLNFYPYHRI